MGISHLFVMDPLAALTVELDSSLRVAFELKTKHHEVYATEVGGLSWLSPCGAMAKARPLLFDGAPHLPRLGEPRALPLSSFAAIHMRKDPPYDLDYITATWLLDGAGPKPKIYNRPVALRDLNEKIAILHFPEASKPALISSNAEDIVDFIVTRASGDGVVKPLLLYGGRGVERVTIGPGKKSVAEALQEMRQLTEGGKVARLVQAFDPAIFQGEVRAFTVGGRALSWCLKKPSAGNFLANTRAGATLHEYTPSPAEKARIESVAQKLFELGVAFVGFDVIGGFISEINITSPRLLQAKSDPTNYYERIAEWVAADVARGQP